MRFECYVMKCTLSLFGENSVSSDGRDVKVAYLNINPVQDINIGKCTLILCDVICIKTKCRQDEGEETGSK